MRYGIKITKNGEGVTVTCRDLPECAYDAKDETEAIKLASGAIPAAMILFYKKKKLAIPLPTPVEDGEAIAYIPTRIQAKILLWDYMIENRYRSSDLAKALGVTPQRVQRLTDLTGDSASMEALDEALRAIGASFDLSVSKN